MKSARRSGTAGAVLLTVLLGAPPAWAQGPVASLPGDQTSCLGPPQGTEPGTPWAQQQLAPERAWPLTKGRGITVAVVDTGVDGHIPQLAGRVQPGLDITTNFRSRADDDCYGHGTFLAGIIAASSAPGTGFAGVAPEVSILPIRCATGTAREGVGALTPAAMALGIREAVDSGAQVINMSASTTTADAALAAAVQYAAEHDVVVVASAANSAQQGDPVTFPASYPSVIAVGAVDQAGVRADFSQTGPFLSLVAPGVNVTSVGPGGPGHWLGSGTSYSAPFVAGVAALVRAYRPGLSAAQVKHRLTATAHHPAAVLPDPGLGWGMVNPLAAVTTVLPEETASGQGAVVAPPPARLPDVKAPDEQGPVLAIMAVFLVAVLIFAVVTISRLTAAARRRSWRPARVAEIVPPITHDK